MDLTSPKFIKELLEKHEIKPSKFLGQNFLIDRNILEKIISASEIKKDDVVLEIGPGIGTLTKELAQRAGRVIAVEKDKKMVEILSETLADYKNIEIIQDDILKLQNLEVKNYKIISNIPYYITSPVIRKFLESPEAPQEIILTIQKEVAQRICAKPPKMSLLALSVQFYAEAKIISYVPKNCFLPAPQVDSAIIKIIPQKKYNIDSDLFFKIAKAGFSHPRKQLVNNLSVLKNSNGVKLDKHIVSEWLLKNNIMPSQRPETLSVSDWVKLAENFYF